MPSPKKLLNRHNQRSKPVCAFRGGVKNLIGKRCSADICGTSGRPPTSRRLSKLNQGQANSEILFYCLFHGVLFGVITLAALRGGPDGRIVGAAYYSFSVVIAAVLFGMLKSYPAALYMSATPLAGLVYLYFFRVGSKTAAIDTFVVTSLLVLLIFYSFRIVAVARSYPELPPAPPSDTPPFRNR